MTMTGEYAVSSPDGRVEGMFVFQNVM